LPGLTITVAAWVVAVVSTETPTDCLTRFPWLHTRDLDESRVVIGELWGRHEVEIKGGVPFETTVNHVEIGQMGLSYVRCPTPLRVRCTVGGDRFTMYLHEEGATECTINAESAVAAPGSAVIVVPGQDARLDSGAVRLLALDFSYTRVEQALIARRLPSARFEHWARHRDLTSPAGASLQSLSRWAARELDRAGTPLVGGPAAEHLEQTLFSLFLACLAEQSPPACPPDPMLGKLQFSDLEHWIKANLCQPLSIDALATITGVSPRAVQMAFRRYRQCTPLEFIRRARLNGIRQELLAQGGEATITKIAMEFGLFHLGHFSHAYRREFGERPAETLRRFRLQPPPADTRVPD
jgi:AraC-like DNA-binding protein